MTVGYAAADDLLDALKEIIEDAPELSSLVVAGLADLTIRSGTPASSRGIVHRFILRYLLLAFVAFAILTVSRESLYGLFAGLFLPVAAILCEAAYEAYTVISGQ